MCRCQHICISGIRPVCFKAITHFFQVHTQVSFHPLLLKAKSFENKFETGLTATCMYYVVYKKSKSNRINEKMYRVITAV